MEHPHQLGPDAAFENLLQRACQEFEALQEMIQSGPTAGQRGNFVARQNRMTAMKSPATSFVFSANRANRFCQKNKAHLKLDRNDCEEFMRATKPLNDVRDVNEHGYDGDQKSEKNKPSMHQHGGVALDETSMAILGADVLMGPVNLRDIYPAVAKMRDIMRRQNHHAPKGSGA
jgi:hypothetical protein